MMRQWNPKTFFRQLTPDVLQMLCRWAELEAPIDESLRRSERVYRAWTAIPESRRRPVEKKLLTVNDMCGTHARPYLDSLATKVWKKDPETLLKSRQWTVQDLAVRLFLEAEKEFKEVTQSYSIDILIHMKEFRGGWALDVKPSAELKERIKEEMERHFQGSAVEGRCKVEDHGDDERFVFWVYYKGEMTAEDDLDDEGELIARFRRNLLRSVAVFHYSSCTLSIKAESKPEQDWIRELFATTVAKDPTYFEDVAKNGRFNFKVLQDEAFDFSIQPGEAIESVSLVKVIAGPKHTDAKSHSVELKAGLSMFGAREALGSHAVNLTEDDLEGIQLLFRYPGKGKAKFRTVNLFKSGVTNLNETQRDQVIRKYLKLWGIDAAAPLRPLAASSERTSAA